MGEEKATENGDGFHGDSIHKKKKKKRAKHEAEETEEATSKKKKKKQKEGMKEKPTVSIAIAGSIIDNAQSLELATRVCPLRSQNPRLLLHCFCFFYLRNYLLFLS